MGRLYVFQIDVVLKCKGFHSTIGIMTTVAPISIYHNCKRDEKKVERKQLQAQVKSKAISYLTLSKYLEMNFIQLRNSWCELKICIVLLSLCTAKEWTFNYYKYIVTANNTQLNSSFN